MSAIHLGYWCLILVSAVETYEFGYHPSSEEFDNQMREKTWTRDLLWQEKHNKKFHPKFNLNKPKDLLLDSVPERHPQMGGAGEDKNKVTGYAESDKITPPSESVAEVASESINFPIYFTNPSTGIVYAITEVGVDTSNSSFGANGSIPIFVSKEQYERDIYLLKKAYETECAKQGRPQIIKLNGASVVNNIDPVVVKAELSVHANRTQLNATKKRKNRHRKAKKRKTPAKNPPPAPLLDTQLEKPSKVNVSSAFSGTPANSTLNRVKKTRKPPANVVVHKLVRRSIISEGIASRSTSNSGQSLKKSKKLVRKSLRFEGNVSRSTSNSGESLNKSKKPVRRSLTSEENSSRSTSKSGESLNKSRKLVRRSSSSEGNTSRSSSNSGESINKSKKLVRRSLRSEGNTSRSTSNSGESLKKSKKLVRRSITSEGNTSRSSSNSGESLNKSKKILSTQIQVTSEYIEPTLKPRTPKNSIEIQTPHTEAPPTPPNPPCKKSAPTAAPDDDDDDYEDYYDFDGTSYADDQSDFADSETDESSEEKDTISDSEENISDYSFPGAVIREEDDEGYAHKERTKKRIKRRRPYNDEYDDYDDDYDNESDDGVLGLFRGLFIPVQWVMDNVFDRAALMFKRRPSSEGNYNRRPKYPQYTVYNSGANGVENEGDAVGDKGNSFGSWLGSWFGMRRRRGITTTTAAPVEEEPGWLESWFGYDVRTSAPEEEESDPWFFGWFDSKPRPKRTTTTTTTTPKPILTISEPLKNPQKWIGLLAQHIVNSTSTLNPPTDATTENPEIPKKISYDKYQIWRLKPSDDSQVKILEEYKRSEEGVRMQWLRGPSPRGFTDVLIPPKMLIDFQGTLDFENIAREILIFDVGKVISYEESKQNDMIPKKPTTGKPIMSWNRYYDYDSIIKYLELTQSRNPQYVELIHIGRSFEGRPLVIAKLEMKKPKDKVTTKKKMKLNKKSDQANSVFIEAGVHGREWISPASATWMINELLKTMKSNRTNLETEYIKNTTWYIMPLSNPDGYEYSHQYDRFWKKTRSRNIAKPNGLLNSAMTWLQKKKSEKICFGVDLDYNWNYSWGRKGSSKSPCNEFFAGPTPFSEPETRALSKFLMDNRKQIKLFISLQAYGQIISYPNKLNSSFQAQKLDDLLDVAMVGTDGLRRRGSKSRYKVDSMNDLIENKSGSSDYFATFEVGIPFTYTIHLADNGVHGFLLPGTYIEPTAKDAYEIITGMIDYI